MLGDFNFPFIKWSNYNINDFSDDKEIISEEKQQAVKLLEFSENFFLDQYIKTATRNGNILDLVFTNNHELIKDYNIIINKKLSDHYIIKIDLSYKLDAPTKHKKINHCSTSIPEYDLLNASEELWLRYNLMLNKVDFETLFENKSATEMVNIFLERIETLVSIVFDKKKAFAENEDSDNEQKSKNKNKIPRNVRILMRNKTKISKGILMSKSGSKIASLKAQLHNIESKLENLYNKRRSSQEKDAISKIKKNPRFFYSYAKKFSKTKCEIGPFIDEKGETITDPIQTSETLRKQYEKVFSDPKDSMKIDNPSEFFNAEFNGQNRTDVIFSHEDIKEAIDELSLTASAGPDGVPPILLKKCKTKISLALEIIFRKSLDTGEIPRLFKRAFVIPIHKGDSRALP